jgi:hypothetical protein
MDYQGHFLVLLKDLANISKNQDYNKGAK